MIDKKIQKIQKFLQDHSQKIGLGKLVSHNKVEYYLNISPENLRKLTSYECVEAANILLRQSLFIQQQINQEKGLAKWCYSYIDYLISNTITEQGSQYTPYKYRKNLAISKDSMAKELHKLLIMLKLKIENMTFIQNNLHKVADSFNNLYFSKKGKE